MKPLLNDLVALITLPDDNYLQQDPEILSIFIEEIDEIFEDLAPRLEHWYQHLSDREDLQRIRTHFHTLKGSGRMVGANSSAELAWSVEDLLNRLLAKVLQPTQDVILFISTVFDVYRLRLAPDFRVARPHQIDIRPLILLGQQLQKTQNLDPLFIELFNWVDAEPSDQSQDEPSWHEQQHIAQLATHQTEDAQIAQETLAIFVEESLEHLQTIQLFLQQNQPDTDHYNMLMRALHTLRGSSAMAEVQHVFEASAKVEQLFKQLVRQEQFSHEQESDALADYEDFLSRYLAALQRPHSDFERNKLSEAFAKKWDSYGFVVDAHVAEQHDKQGLVSQLLALNIDHILDAEFEFEQRLRPEYPDYVAQLIKESQVLQKHTEQNATRAIHDYAQLLQQCYQSLLDKPILIEFAEIEHQFHAAHLGLLDLFDGLAAGLRLQQLEIPTSLQQLLNFVRQQPDVLTALFEQIHPKPSQPAATTPQQTSQHFDVAQIATRLAQDRKALNASAAHQEFDPDLLDIFLEEAEELLSGIDKDLNRWSQNQHDTAALKNLMRYLHTLKGGANMVQTTHMGSIAHELETIYQRLIQQQMAVSPELIAIIRLLQDDISDRVQILRDQQIDYPAQNALAILQDLDGVMASAWQTQPEHSSSTHSTDATSKVDSWSIRQIEPATASENMLTPPLFDDAHALSSSNQTKLAADFEVAEFLAQQFANDTSALNVDQQQSNTELEPDELVQHTPELDQLQVISAESDGVTNDLSPDVVATDANADFTFSDVQTEPTVSTELSQETLQETSQQTFQDASQETSPESSPQSSVVLTAEIPLAPLSLDAPSAVAQTLMSDQLEATAAPAKSANEPNHRVKKKAKAKQNAAEAASFSMTFDDELSIGYDRLQRLWQEWTEQRSQRSVLLQLQRNTQLMQRMAMQRDNHDMANLLLRLESIFEQFSVYNFQSGFYDASIIQALDWLQNSIYQQQKPVAALIQLLSGIQLAPSSQPQSNSVVEKTVGLDYVQGQHREPPSMMGEWEKGEQTDQNNEMIRVSADMIEKMIDLSGENAINRSRIEMDLGQLATTLQEMEQTIQRLADQLRRMEGELETQILAKHEHSTSRYADFDPLEMDQYSSLNQLSKSLAESASDLVDFKITLANKIRDTESLLLQQSRIQAEIQESLMRTRLVPFSRLLPRLQRIVRQTSSTLNRPAELVVQNTEGELDRSILERLVTPLEHMLRNAVDHGLEDREQRLAANKPEMGLIELNIQRQGTDVVVTFSDDGKGIDVARVQQKAEQMGLLSKGQSLEKDDILQFIFHPGFSTASQVTQISGRGVGLDVVLSDIKTLGGHVSVSSELGKGTTFVIRVPTTVAVGDALMVRVGDQQFALPLAQIDRIVRIAPSTLAQYFASQEDQFSIDHVAYKLRYLGEFTDNQPFAHLSGVAHSLPVILIKGSSGQTIALLVDQLIGSRSQIVVKPVGQQFANVGVIAGATILGDGQVCLILDAQHLVRQIQATVRVKQKQGHKEPVRLADTRHLIMIVDDSVTVRKVTSRLLERQGFEVVTAKDGVDAMEQLEGIQPDLMLLDIEMPRMDGFEVTNLVRHHSVHAQLPIIMITSRAGEKHRERAFSLGVNQYMGKPFQEAELLNNIQQLLTVTAEG